MSDIQNVKIRFTGEADFSEVDQSLKKLTEEEKALKKQFDEVNEAAKKQSDTLDKETKKQVRSIKDLEESVKSLTKRRNESTDPDRIKQYNLMIAKQNDEIQKLTTKTGTLKDLFGKIGNLMPGAFNAGLISEFSAGITSAQVATTGLITKMGILKTALIATGIGALIIALTSLASYLFKTESGSEALERGLKSIGAAVDVVIGKFANLGKGIVQLFSGEWQAAVDTFRHSFDNIGSDISKAAKAANEFTNELQDIEDAENNLAVKVAETRNEIQKLMIQSRNRATTEAERISLLQQAEALEKQIIGEQISLQERKVAALQKENDLKVKNGEIDKGNKTDQLREAEIELANLRGNSLELLEKIQNREDALLLTKKELSKEEKAYWEMKNRYQAEDLKLSGKIGDDEVKKYEDTSNKKIKISKDEQQKIKEIGEQASDEMQAKLDDDYQKALQYKANIQALKEQGTQIAITIANGLFQLSQENRQAEIADIQNKQQQELKAVGDNKQAQAVINARYAKEVAKLKAKEAQSEKDQALFNIGIQTAQNVVKAFPNPLLIALAAAMGIAQAAIVSAKPIPKFNKGTKSVPGFDTGDDSVYAMLRPGEGVMPVDRMKDYRPAFNAIFDRKVSPEMLNSFVMDYGKWDRAITVNNTTADLGGLKTELKSLNKKLDKLQILNVQMDQKGFKTYLSKGESKTQLENNYLRVG